jgi:hypothetical protein
MFQKKKLFFQDPYEKKLNSCKIMIYIIYIITNYSAENLIIIYLYK